MSQTIKNGLKKGAGKLKSAAGGAAHKIGRGIANKAHSAKALLMSLKKAVSHESWKPIPGDLVKSVKDPSLSDKLTDYNSKLEKLDDLKLEEASIPKELKEFKKEFKDFLKMAADPDKFAKSTKEVTVKLPGGGSRNINAKDSTSRKEQASQTIASVKETAAFQRYESLLERNPAEERKALKEELRGIKKELLSLHEKDLDTRTRQKHDTVTRGRQPLPINTRR